MKKVLADLIGVLFALFGDQRMVYLIIIILGIFSVILFLRNQSKKQHIEQMHSQLQQLMQREINIMAQHVEWEKMKDKYVENAYAEGIRAEQARVLKVRARKSRAEKLKSEGVRIKEDDSKPLSSVEK